MNATWFYGKLEHCGLISLKAVSQVLGEKWGIYDYKCRNKHAKLHLQPFRNTIAMKTHQLDQNWTFKIYVAELVQMKSYEIKLLKTELIHQGNAICGSNYFCIYMLS